MSVTMPKYIVAVVAIAMATVPLSNSFAAAQNDDPNARSGSFGASGSEKVNAWVDGTVVSVNTETGKFSVLGAKRPYASAYAKMLIEIESKTVNLDRAAREPKATEIRNAWRDKLAAAQKESWDKNSDFTFSLPAKDARLTVYDESNFYGRELHAPEATTAAANKLRDRDAVGRMALGDLQVGAHVIVGYETGIITNHAYAIIKANYADTPYADAQPAISEKEGVAADNSKINQRDQNKDEVTADQQKQNKSDIEITRNIRRAIVKDDSLSTYAHNIKIITQDGAVTLKGPVKSAEEKAEVEKKAAAVAGAGRITSEIGIAP